MEIRPAQRPLRRESLRRAHVPFPAGEGAAHGRGHVRHPRTDGRADGQRGRGAVSAHVPDGQRDDFADASRHVDRGVRLGVRLRELRDVGGGVSGLSAAGEAGPPKKRPAKGPGGAAAGLGAGDGTVCGDPVPPLCGGDPGAGPLLHMGQAAASALLGRLRRGGAGGGAGVLQRRAGRPSGTWQRPPGPAQSVLSARLRPAGRRGMHFTVVFPKAAAHRLSAGGSYCLAYGGNHRPGLLEQPAAAAGRAGTASPRDLFPDLERRGLPDMVLRRRRLPVLGAGLSGAGRHEV